MTKISGIWASRTRHRLRGVIVCIIPIIYVTFLIHIIIIISIISQVQVKLGIADHVWQKKRAALAIAGTIDAVGDRFKPELQTGWFAYIRETYSDWLVAPAATVGEETLVLDD